jgi:hypothetical protein
MGVQMAWVRIQDEMPEHPKLAKVGPLGLALYVAGLCYCNRHLTDGFIPRAKAAILMGWTFYGPPGEHGEKVHQIGVSCGMSGSDVENEYVIDLLCGAGLWDEVPGGYSIHDYLDHQTSRQEVMDKRESVQQRVNKHRNAIGNGGVTSPRSKKEEVRSTEEESKSKPLPADAGEELVLPIEDGTCTPSEWQESHAEFYGSYPRKVQRPDSERAWKKVKPQNHDTFNAIMDGLEAWAGHWALKTDRDKIPYPASWLNAHQWEDQP